MEDGNPHEGGGGDRNEPARAQGASANPDERHDDERDDGGFQAREDARHRGKSPVRGVDRGEAPEDEDRRENEEHAGHDSSPRSVQKPADVDRELLRFRPRQEHAVREGVKKALLGDPAPPVHEVPLHDRDLAGRSAEADESESEPVAEGLPEPDVSRTLPIPLFLRPRLRHARPIPGRRVRISALRS